MPNICPEEDENTNETSETEEVLLTRTPRSYWTWQETLIFDKPDPPTENWTGT